MTRDRAKPFSRKHRLIWLTVTGGMILIMAINVGLGLLVYDTKPRTLPTVAQPPDLAPPIDASEPAPDAGQPLDGGPPLDGGVDAAP